MKQSKFLALMMAFVMLVTALTGCGGNNNADTGKNNDASNQPSSTPAQTGDTPNTGTSDGLPAMTTDEITLTVALWGQHEKGETEAREHQIAAFEKAYPNIHVEFVSIDQADWNATLTARAADGTLPDVFGVFQVVDAIANNWALDVTEFYENDPDAQEVYPDMINNVRFGYFTEAGDGWFGFLGGSPYSEGNSIKTYSKPVPGTAQGVHYVDASDNVQTIEGNGNTEDIQGGGSSWADYCVNVDRADAFDFTISYTSESGGIARLYLDDAVIMEELELHPTGDSKTLHVAQKYGLQLSEGKHTLRLEWDGFVTISEFSLSCHEDVAPFTATFDEFPENILAADGQTWSIQDGVLTLAYRAQPVGKQVYGSEAWRDYEVSVDVTVTDGSMDAGVIFRVNNPANGGAGDDPMLSFHILIYPQSLAAFGQKKSENDLKLKVSFAHHLGVHWSFSQLLGKPPKKQKSQQLPAI